MRAAAALVMLFTTPVLAGCGLHSSGNEANQPAPPETNVAVSAPAVLPAVEQPLPRRDLILAAMQSASDLVTGTDDKALQQRLDGRSFSFRIRLCEGAPSRDRVTFDPDDRVLRIAVSPDLNAEDPVAKAAGAGRFEAVEGFWVPYPWLLQAACPPAGVDQPTKEEESAAQSVEPTPGRPTLGLAQFFPAEGDRSAQRQGRPFSVTRRLAEGEPPGPVDLVLQGRLNRVPDGKVINCVATAPLLPPQCIISVRFDSVRLEQARTGELLAEWSGA